MHRNRKGFTLIELLVSVLVIGILAALIFPRLGPVRERAYVSAMKNTLNKIVQGEENYKELNGVYVDFATLSTATGIKADEDVTPNVVPELDAQYGFTATVTHMKTKAQCGIQFGSTGPGAIERAGKIVCSQTGAPVF